FTYTLLVINHGPSNATGVRVVDDLPPQVTYVSASHTNLSGLPGRLEFSLGNLAAGASRTITVDVRVNPGFVGTFYANNIDREPTTVKVDPASLGGHVYVDQNKNGIRDAGERPLAGVVIALTGNNLQGQFISRTTVTDANGAYLFTNLDPGEYIVFQPNQPAGYRDGLESLGNTFNRSGVLQAPNGQIVPDTNSNDDRDADAFEGIVLGSGYAARDYNFGELAVTATKRNFIQPMRR
ncbi:MAG TPA: SdrD B-like domain-containing protein, partial [Lacipirellulaceae bacterium]|nr:SdrD B-like domain-containing protein [Lacipirellulaceae bacterium]